MHNFIYKIVGVNLSDTDISQINNISSRSKIKDRITEIISKNGKFEFIKTQRTVFSNNLILIDSFLPQILSSVLFQFYSSTLSDTESLVKITEEKKPLGFDTSDKHLFYSYKIKRFLTDIALGMMPSKVWTGQYDATGGYLIVKADGEILCYHVYNKNEFENYLLANTKLETASSTRHGFGELYEESGQLYFKLNLQIRFK
jgi:type II restriction enzyme